MRAPLRKTGAAVSALKAASLVPDGAVIAVSGFNMATTPEYLLGELLRIHRRTGHPAGLFLLADALPATPGRGLDLVAQEDYLDEGPGLLRGASVPFLGFSPWMQKLVMEERIEAYSWPMGVAAYWFREVASGRPGVISKIGIDTAIDPEKGGGMLNALAKKRRTCTVTRVVIDGDEFLLYKAPKPNFGLVRGTTADGHGNITMEEEAIRGTVLGIAQATKAHPSPGTVIAQVRRVTKAPCPARSVEVPGPLVDYLVVSPQRYHWEAGSAPRLSDLQGRSGRARGLPEKVRPDQLVISRRVLMELTAAVARKNAPVVVNLGIGTPALVSGLAIAEGVADFIVTVLESGQWGGLALPGVDFGIALNPFALSTMPDMFSNFEGGTIDAASLGFLQVGENGDVNPSMLPGRIYGPGGFPVIAGGSPRIYFAGAFTAGGEVEVEGGRLRVKKEGAVLKFVKKPFKNFFSGAQALKFEKEVLYVTERAVLRLTPSGLTLTEVAPGVDVDRDVLGRMEFRPSVARDLVEMDSRLFDPRPMGLSKGLRGPSA
jgi:propionate CoA-transferase